MEEVFVVIQEQERWLAQKANEAVRLIDKPKHIQQAYTDITKAKNSRVIEDVDSDSDSDGELECKETGNTETAFPAPLPWSRSFLFLSHCNH